ncbi:uncharacterized protein [Temnothorax nylanderi]|uniref:uncharacterized protein n=1 Tax=Temnothorax nylanderi TaxID=102681 RepID=UPI003A89B902
MPRYYAKKKKTIDYENILNAIKSVKIHNNSIRTAATAHNIPKSTLAWHIGNFENEKIDVATANVNVMENLLLNHSTTGKTIFNAVQERALMKYILKASDINYELSLLELRKLAYEYAKKIGISYPDSWDVKGEASSDWQLSFMKRNRNLSLRTPEQVSQYRSKSFNKENVDAFFSNLSSVLNATPFEAHRIWNMDESGCPTVPTKAVKIIAPKGKKRVGTATSAERGTNVTLALSVSATGQSIPPFFIFPRKNMKDVYMTHATQGAVGIANGSGWMTADEFLKYMKHFVKHAGANKDSPTFLLLDNHMSHLSIDVLELAVDHGITMLSFPPHCTHRMQPLDVSVFGPFKTMYTIKYDAWKKSNVGVAFDLHHVPLIVDQCLDTAVTPKNIKAGFRATGIFPFDPHVFTEIDFIASDLSGENEYDDDEEDEDNQRRVIVSGDAIPTTAHEEVVTSEPSTSSVLSAKDLRGALKSVGPLKLGTPAKKSNRGRKPLKSVVLTSPENLSDQRDKTEKRRSSLLEKDDAKKKKGRGKSKTPQKKIPPPDETEDEEDIDFCIICMKNMPKNENRRNTAYCVACDRGVHLSCAGADPNTFKCHNCDPQ